MRRHSLIAFSIAAFGGVSSTYLADALGLAGLGAYALFLATVGIVTLIAVPVWHRGETRRREGAGG